MKCTSYEIVLERNETGVHVKIEAGSLVAYRDALISELSKINAKLKEPYSADSNVTTEVMELAIMANDDIKKEIESIKED